ncbi:MAG: glycosyltransferase [Gammaproteobacteria bacterium]
MQSRKIRLLKFITDFNIGGTERQILNLVQRLDPARYELEMACFRRTGPFFAEFAARNIPLSEYNTNRLYNYTALREQLKFAAHVRRNQIQIVHAYGFYANVFAVASARLAGVPVIVASIRDTGDHLTGLQRRVQRLICLMADCVLANAEAVRQSLIAEGYRPEKIHVIHNGIAFPRVPPRNRGRSRLRREFALPPAAPLVAVFSRLIRNKGIEYFLEAVLIAAKRCPDARFLVVGDGFYKKELQQKALDLGLGDRLVFTGFRMDVPEVLSEVTVSVLPSLSEGLSNALLESMAAGVPVVATRVGGNPEAMGEGATGMLVPPRDALSLADAICRLLENPEMAAGFGRAGRRRVEERFSLDQMVRATERLYLRLLGNGRYGSVAGFEEEWA